MVAYAGHERPGTVIVSLKERRLYLVQPGGSAIKYGVGVGRPGFTWSGAKTIAMMREWPDWTPPPQMLKRRPDLPRHMKGGIDNPLGARAMYLGGSMFRIHGSNEPETIAPGRVVRLHPHDQRRRERPLRAAFMSGTRVLGRAVGAGGSWRGETSFGKEVFSFARAGPAAQLHEDGLRGPRRTL